MSFVEWTETVISEHRREEAERISAEFISRLEKLGFTVTEYYRERLFDAVRDIVE